MLTKFKKQVYEMIAENVCLNDQLKDITDAIKNKIDDVTIKQNQIFLVGTVEQICKQLDLIKELIKDVIESDDVELFYPNIIEFDRKWLHGKTRDENEQPADIDILGCNIDVEGKWSSLRDSETFAVISKGSINDIKKNVKKFIGDQKDKVFMLVVSTMVGSKANTIIDK